MDVPEPRTDCAAGCRLSGRNCTQNERIAADSATIRHPAGAMARCWNARPTKLDILPRRWHQDPTAQLENGRIQMKQFLLKMFTWWSGQTFGTQLWTWRFGELVGEDEQGNRYF